MGNSRRWVLGATVSRKRLVLFTRQLATLVKAGLPLVRSLEVLGRQERPGRLRDVLEHLSATIRSGGDLSDGLAAQPGVFDRLYVSTVRAGEVGGVLEQVLERLASFMEKSERLKHRVVSALTYPLIVLALALGIVAALMIVVVPKFEQIFAGLLKGQPLPPLTQLVLGISRLVQDHFLVVLGTLLALVIGAAFARRSEAGRRLEDWGKLHAPIVGPLFRKVAIARFARTFGTLLASGVPILHALLITKDTSGNWHVADAIGRVHDRVKAGDNLAGPLAATGVFPGMVTSMIEVGEATGDLPTMLAHIAASYDDEVDTAVASLTSMIEPLMIVLLAGMVGTVVIALFLPIVSIIQYLQ